MGSRISESQIADRATITHAELTARGVSGAAFYAPGAQIASTAAVGQIVTFTSVIYLQAFQIDAGDLLVITGGVAAGTYTVASVTTETTLTTVEAIVNSTAVGSAAFYRPTGAQGVGFVGVGTLDGKVNVSDAVQHFDYSRKIENDTGSAFTVRQVVQIEDNTKAVLASASSTDNTKNIGVVIDASIAAAAQGYIVVKPGAIIGGFSGLIPGDPYYVSYATPGLITHLSSLSSYPSGTHVFKVGKALNTTELLFHPEYVIAL